VLIPKTTSWLDTFLEPTFARSSVVHQASDGKLILGLVLGAALGLLGIFIAYSIWGKANGEVAVRIRERVPALHRFFFNKWYFDELIDWVVVRPFGWFGRFGQQTFERIFVNGTLVGGTSGVVRAGSAAVRAMQSGFLRAYAALLLVGAGAVILYFLIQSS
jgi:NADH-quinone oxidoreductase subunit L